MDHLRETIELLTKIMFQNATIKIKAEVFRAAKFNKPEAVVAMWKLLFKLISYCEFGKVDDVTEQACDKLLPEELVAYVKREIQHRGYKSVNFARLPTSMTDGSRELLLAFSWLLYTEQVMKHFVLNCTSILDDDTTSLHEQSVIDSECGSDFWAEPSGDTWQRVEQLLVFNNKLRMNLRSLYSAQCERLLMKHKMHEATSGMNCATGSFVTSGHLSMLEIYMLRHPDALTKNIELLEKDSNRLQNLLRWRELEGIFWKWMESVLEVKQTEQQQLECAASGGATSLALEGATGQQLDGISPVLEGAACRLADSRSNLQREIMKYESLVERLEQICQHKIEVVSREDVDAVVMAIDAELSRQKACLSQQATNVNTRQEMEPLFVLDKSNTSSAKRDTASAGETSRYIDTWSDSTSSVDTPVVRDIDIDIALLQKVVNELETDIEHMTTSFNDHMRRASSQLHGAVCIPPLQTTH